MEIEPIVTRVDDTPIRILIDGLPRSGTTTLARLFSLHPATRVIIEPFHPRRFDGVHHEMVHRRVIDPFGPTWIRWNVIKHVWEPSSPWPFLRRRDLQTRLWQSSSLLIAVTRKNLTKRYISAALSRTLGFWMGTRDQFVDRLANVCLLPFDIDKIKNGLNRDREALQARDEFLRHARVSTCEVIFEEFFGASRDDQLRKLNELFVRGGLSPLVEDVFNEQALRWLDPEIFKWSSDEVYRAIPNVAELNEQLVKAGEDSLFG